MFNCRFVLFVLLGTSFSLCAPSFSEARDYSSDRRTALVVGNSSYLSNKLYNPVNDANDVAVVLKKLGFQVDLRIDADHKSMHSAFRNFGKRLQQGGVGLRSVIRIRDR